jgi:hypothetical protein
MACFRPFSDPSETALKTFGSLQTYYPPLFLIPFNIAQPRAHHAPIVAHGRRGGGEEMLDPSLLELSEDERKACRIGSLAVERYVCVQVQGDTAYYRPVDSEDKLNARPKPYAQAFADAGCTSAPLCKKLNDQQLKDCLQIGALGRRHSATAGAIPIPAIRFDRQRPKSMAWPTRARLVPASSGLSSTASPVCVFFSFCSRFGHVLCETVHGHGCG